MPHSMPLLWRIGLVFVCGALVAADRHPSFQGSASSVAAIHKHGTLGDASEKSKKNFQNAQALVVVPDAHMVRVQQPVSSLAVLKVGMDPDIKGAITAVMTMFGIAATGAGIALASVGGAVCDTAHIFDIVGVLGTLAAAWDAKTAYDDLMDPDNSDCLKEVAGAKLGVSFISGVLGSMGTGCAIASVCTGGATPVGAAFAFSGMIFGAVGAIIGRLWALVDLALQAWCGSGSTDDEPPKLSAVGASGEYTDIVKGLEEANMPLTQDSFNKMFTDQGRKVESKEQLMSVHAAVTGYKDKQPTWTKGIPAAAVFSSNNDACYSFSESGCALSIDPYDQAKCGAFMWS